MKFRKFCFIFIFNLCISNALLAQNLTVRNAHSMIYDSHDKRILLFGGADEKQVYSDLWELKDLRWKPLIINEKPKPRTFASFVYDKKNKRAILFGGNKVLFGSDKNPAKFFNDTWEFKNNKWKILNLANSPEPRAEAAIVYDKKYKRIILFGGYTIKNEKVVKLKDTWELKNNVWRKINDNQISARNGAVMVFHSQLKKPVLFGGSTINKDYGVNSGETWILEKDVWRKLAINQPANIFNASMVYQDDLNRLFRFGGWNGEERINETWIFKNNIWEKLSIGNSLKPRNHAAMAYDPKSKQTILFGGHDGEKIFGDLWIFKQGKWYKEFETPPIIRVANGH